MKTARIVVPAAVVVLISIGSQHSALASDVPSGTASTQASHEANLYEDSAPATRAQIGVSRDTSKSSVMPLGVPIPFDYTFNITVRVKGRDMNPDTTGIFCNTMTKTQIDHPGFGNVRVNLIRNDLFDDVIDTFTYTQGIGTANSVTHCFDTVPDLTEDYYFEYNKATDGDHIAGNGHVF